MDSEFIKKGARVWREMQSSEDNTLTIPCGKGRKSGTKGEQTKTQMDPRERRSKSVRSTKEEDFYSDTIEMCKTTF